MDYGTYRGIYTLILLVLFLGIIYWAYSKNKKKDFDDAAQSIFDEDELNKAPKNKESSND
jgi:cytochrome c oxidase cbb3-type subunit 4